jgi:hypothetical protein
LAEDEMEDEEEMVACGVEAAVEEEEEEDLPTVGKCKFTVSPVCRLLTDFVCMCTYEFCFSLWKIVRSSVILLLRLSWYLHLPTAGRSSSSSTASSTPKATME